jgi:signal transduction histidine kinase
MLHFNPRARIIRTVGDQLISGPEAAVIELVKNAHDADASYVRVKFEPPLEKGKGRITVADDGHGMTYQDIQEKWMEPATTDKIDRSTSPGGRPLLGSKGVGRFATAKLGHSLELTTTGILPGKTELQTTRVYGIDWDLFDQTKYLSEIEFPFEELKPNSHTGTKLVISKLRDRWTDDALVRLHHEMRRLISPLETTEDEAFRIYLDLSACTATTCGIDGDGIVNEPLPNRKETRDQWRVRPFPVLKACDYEVSGEFEPDGTFNGTLTVHRGDLEPERVRLEVPLDRSVAEAPCGAVLVHLFIFDRDERALTQMARRAGYGSISGREARAILDRVAGIAIYRDRFRIRPYGDNDKDWLTLDRRRVQNPTTCIGHNQVSGILVVDSEARSGLIERSSREGLEVNGSFRRLHRLIIELLAKKIEPRRFAFREDAGLGRRRKETLSDAYRVAQLRALEDFVSNLPEPARTEGREAVQEATRSLTGHLEAVSDRLATLETRVTLGFIVGEVLHEGQGPVLFIQTETARFARRWPTICARTAEAEKHRQDVPRFIRGMVNSSDKLRRLFSALEPLSSTRRGKPQLYSPNQVVVDTLHLLESRAAQLGIKFERKSALNVSDIVGYREDLATALTNIIDNALYWLAHSSTRDPTINVQISQNDASCIIDVHDNGPGIPDEFRDSVFEVGFTLKVDGTGLGLSIAREAISRAGGTIDLLETVRGAGFRIVIPREG